MIRNLVVTILLALLFFGVASKFSGQVTITPDIVLDSHSISINQDLLPRAPLANVNIDAKPESYSTTTTTLPPLTVTITLSKNGKTIISKEIYTSVPLTLALPRASPLPALSSFLTTSSDTNFKDPLQTKTSSVPSSTSMPNTSTEAENGSERVVTTSTAASSTARMQTSSTGQEQPTMSVITLGSDAKQRAWNPLGLILEMIRRL
ncbi:Hypothetical protein D9617_10g072310 [Elsinoe fawcettii]|nr:Hypothetical protein D9617_10g072310 [Elsinoe fawcettii]